MSQNLPALIDSASRHLAEAKTSAELLQARDVAKAALHYAKITKATNDTQADCLRIIISAQNKMADEIDAGQERGEVAKKSESYVQDTDKTTLTDIGISRQRVSEYRKMRDMGEEAINDAIQIALDNNEAPTMGGVASSLGLAAKRSEKTQYTGWTEWYTPREYIEASRAVMGSIDLDPASNEMANAVVKADKYYTAETDGLEQRWLGNIWLNPPYAQPHIANFVSKLVREYECRNVEQAILLTHNNTDTKWFLEASEHCDAVCFTTGRVKFYAPNGTIAAPASGQAFFYFGPYKEAFRDVFDEVGIVMELLR